MQCGWSLLGPLQWIRYVNKQVKVKAGKDEEHRGWLLTVDPVSASLVLVNFLDQDDVGGGRASVQVVMGHAVQEVQVLQEADQETTERLQSSFLPPRSRPLAPEQLHQRRAGVRRWLEQNRVPVQEDGEELLVAGALTITAPYGPEDCCSSNQIILDRVQRLIQSQPAEPPIHSTAPPNHSAALPADQPIQRLIQSHTAPPADQSERSSCD
ncbi:gem-associated protein 6 isoform X2 [Sander lucioperca]|uniref:gem-associated protein 6 isoform X2 n=1 Tax=Sander lucioperca TaxID=283035 RepID=UPI001653BE5A|nr:gem-associated protein 6 isoform X2 [Sander lucioperca]